jgi:hypothetical protein
LKSTKKLAATKTTKQGTAEAFFDMVVGLEEEAKVKGNVKGLLVTPFFEYHIMVSTRTGKPVEAADGKQATR